MSQDVLNNEVSEDLEKCPVLSCKSPARLLCTGCHTVSYCSTAHQRSHWKIHKSECRPYIVKRNDTFGRYLVASRDLPKGTIILTEGPLAVGPKRMEKPVCLGCHNLADCSYRCSKCSYPVCDETCEKSPIHAEWECPVFAAAKKSIGPKITCGSEPHPGYESITPLRALLLRDRDPKTFSNKLLEMEHHNDLRESRTPKLWHRNEVNTVNLLRDWYSQTQFSPELIHTICGIIDVNAFEIKWGESKVYCGLFQETSLMLHDCSPNTHHATTTTYPHQMIVRASVDIKKGEVISTSYADVFKGNLERRGYLKRTKYFDCWCERCKDGTEFGTFLCGIKCTGKCEGYFVPESGGMVGLLEEKEEENEWICSGCGQKKKYSEIKKLVEQVEEEIGETREIEKLEEIMEKYSGTVLHQNHYIILSVIKKLLKGYNSPGEVRKCREAELEEKRKYYQRVIHLSKRYLQVLDILDPGLCRERAMTLFNMAYKTELPFAKLQLNNGEISKETFTKKLDEILEKLNIAKETLELDKLILDKPFLYLAVVEEIDEVLSCKGGI